MSEHLQKNACNYAFGCICASLFQPSLSELAGDNIPGWKTAAKKMNNN
jgi:hypothetical protein